MAFQLTPLKHKPNEPQFHLSLSYLTPLGPFFRFPSKGNDFCSTELLKLLPKVYLHVFVIDSQELLAPVTFTR